MTTNKHRARARLNAMSQACKWVFDALSKIREVDRDWPDYIYVPLTALKGRLRNILSHEDIMLLLNSTSNDRGALAEILSTGIVLGTWRVTQGIYRFDETLYPQLINTHDAGKIPVDILYHLPEWCVYLETPGLMLPIIDGTETPIHGAWVSIDMAAQGQMMLAITPDTDCVDCGDGITMTAQNLPTISLTHNMLLLPDATIEDGLAVTFEPLALSGYDPLANLPREEVIRKAAEWVKPIVNLLLYLCAGADYAGPAPQNPQPKKTKHGLRLFPPNNPTVWDVGVRMGSALRAAYAAQSAGDGASGRQVRPHIRRAHWHGFRSGARLTPEGLPIPTEKRRFDLRWLPPIAVNIDDIGNDNLPSVIRTVK